MGVFVRGNKLWIRYKDASGAWVNRATGLPTEERAKAESLYRKVLSQVGAREEIEVTGELTVEKWGEVWLKKYRKHVEDVGGDRAKLRDHINPVIGPMLLDEVRPRHIADVISKVRCAEDKDGNPAYAPKTVRNIYSVLKSMFKSAALRDLITQTPCILDRQELGPIEDKIQGWRPTARFGKPEVVLLLTDPRVPWDRRVAYALEGLAGVRHGELAGLCWKHYEPELLPLGRILVVRSYDKVRTKTRRTRPTPVHPTLAQVLADWRAVGWVEMMGRAPGPDDLIVPCPKRRKFAAGRMRDKSYSYKMLVKDLAALGLRHRRGHDLRRTMISLSREDGARKDLLELCTHTPRRDAAIEAYTTIEWPALCAEVAKLKLDLVTVAVTGDDVEGKNKVER